jgi:hypothetical protein
MLRMRSLMENTNVLWSNVMLLFFPNKETRPKRIGIGQGCSSAHCICGCCGIGTVAAVPVSGGGELPPKE